MPVTLPPNPTPDDYQKYYESLPPDQQHKFRKVGLIKLINTIYTSGITDVQEDPTPAAGTITSGTFNDGDEYFDFKLIKSGGEPTLVYQPSKNAPNTVPQS